MPGISGKAFKGVKRDKNDVWANSGFGLYMTSRLCREGGSFYVASGNSSLMLSETQKDSVKINFVGTALRLTLDTRQLNSLNKSLEQYRNDAYDIKSKFMDSNMTASIASTMLSKDFK
jgi:hypothetical protein